MTEDIVNRLENRLFWSDAEEAANEIQLLRKIADDWRQTAKTLALDLGHAEYAQEVYEDISSGLYDKVRGRIGETKEKDA
jgi:hypothetical protein